MDAPVLVNPLVLQAVQLALNGEREPAVQQLEELWRTLSPSDGFHRCIVAHYLADLQLEPADELSWDQAALSAALGSAPESFEGKIPGIGFDSFLPSLHLNLASSFERIGSLDAAKEHARSARQLGQGAGQTPLDEMTRSAILRICVRLGLPVE